MGETMKRLLHVGIAVCCKAFAAQVMTSFIRQSAEVATLLQPLHPAISILGHSKSPWGRREPVRGGELKSPFITWRSLWKVSQCLPRCAHL